MCCTGCRHAGTSCTELLESTRERGIAREWVVRWVQGARLGSWDMASAHGMCGHSLQIPAFSQRPHRARTHESDSMVAASRAFGTRGPRAPQSLRRRPATEVQVLAWTEVLASPPAPFVRTTATPGSHLQAGQRVVCEGPLHAGWSIGGGISDHLSKLDQVVAPRPPRSTVDHCGLWLGMARRGHMGRARAWFYSCSRMYGAHRAGCRTL